MDPQKIKDIEVPEDAELELEHELIHDQHRDSKRDQRAAEREARHNLAVEYFTKG